LAASASRTRFFLDRQSPLAAKYRRTLTALQLLRKQSTPLRPRFHTRLFHSHKIAHPSSWDKMRFT
jgi:hypothetical protein